MKVLATTPKTPTKKNYKRFKWPGTKSGKIGVRSTYCSTFAERKRARSVSAIARNFVAANNSMMYCPRCNNTHWVKTNHRNLKDRLAILLLRRPLRCIKCDRVRLGSIFLDFKPLGARKPKRKIARDNDISELKCPQCGSSVRRSHRRSIERLIFFIRAYRCLDCRTRFRTVRL